MTLKLPTPLPYEDVDANIDEAVDFYDNIIENAEGEMLRLYHANPHGRRRGNYGRMIIQLMEHCPPHKPDEDGYIHWVGGGPDAWYYSAKPMTEREIDSILGFSDRVLESV